MKTKREIMVYPIGDNQVMDTYRTLNEFVHYNFSTLIEGAKRAGDFIPADAFAPARACSNESTRIHRRSGLKWVNGLNLDDIDNGLLSEEDLAVAISDIQFWLDKASEEVRMSYELKVEKK